MDYLIFSAMRMRKRHLFCSSSHHNGCMKNNDSLTRGLNLELSVLVRARAQLINMHYINTHLSVPHGPNIQKTVLHIQLLVVSQKMPNYYLFSSLFFVLFCCFFFFFCCTQLNSSPATDNRFQFYFNLCFIVFVMSLSLANLYPRFHHP